MADNQQGQAQGQQGNPAKTLIERVFQTVNISTSPAALGDQECSQIDNLMPFAPGNMAVTPGPSEVMAAPAGVTLQRFWPFVFASTLFMVAQGTDGSVYIGPVGGSWTKVANAGATTPNGLHMTRWNGADVQGNPDAILWVDTVKGYGSLTPTTWTVLDADLIGQCLAVYQGRVWIGSSNEVIFSAPGSYNDFEAADYAGGFHVNDPSFNGPVVGLQVTQNWLYILGAGLMALNNVQVQSVAGSTTLVTTYYLTPVSSSISISNEQAALVLDNVLIVCSNGELYAFYGQSGQAVSQSMGTNFNGTQFLVLAQIYGKAVVLTSAGYALMLNERQWFTMLEDVTNWIGYGWINSSVPNGPYTGAAISGFACTGSAIYQIGADMTTARACTLTTKLYDAGNASIDKQVIKMGVELFPNELIQPLPTSLDIAITETLLGYLARSETMDMLASVNTIIPQNLFLPTTVNMVDRYFAMEVNLTASPGVSIGAILFQFRDSTPWPNRRINVVNNGAIPNGAIVDNSPVTIGFSEA